MGRQLEKKWRPGRDLNPVLVTEQILHDVERATAAYTRPDYTTRASSFIKKGGYYLNFSLIEGDEIVDVEVSDRAFLLWFGSFCCSEP